MTVIPNVVPSGLCARCGRRHAELWWAEGAIAFVHGVREGTCRVCALERRIEAAKKAVGDLPALERELAALLAEEVRHV